MEKTDLDKGNEAIAEDIEAGLEECVRLGLMERSGTDADGGPMYRLTKKGEREALEKFGIHHH